MWRILHIFTLNAKLVRVLADDEAHLVNIGHGSLTCTRAKWLENIYEYA